MMTIFNVEKVILLDVSHVNEIKVALLERKLG